MSDTIDPTPEPTPEAAAPGGPTLEERKTLREAYLVALRMQAQAAQAKAQVQSLALLLKQKYNLPLKDAIEVDE